ncbi:MAG TPA: response regulator [Gemmatimonadales bacterium]|nr:response regulator [Gemmatimonadales bacterium]
MTSPQPIPATVLIAATLERAAVAAALEGAGFSIIQTESGVSALGRARVVRPDAIILANVLPDMPGIEACRLLHADPLVGSNVPVVILTGDTPSPAERVAGLSAGVWDFFRHPRDTRELALKLQTYIEARRNVTGAVFDGGVDPVNGLHARPSLVRRIRELGGLMTRMHGALACIVFDTDIPDSGAPATVSQVTRVSDIVGILSPTQFAVLAPATNATGAAALARRVAAILRNGAAGDGRGAQALLTGYDAVDNLTYAPINPPDLIARATAAVRTGKPEPANHWLRRYEPGTAGEAPRNTPVNVMMALDRKGS